MLVSNNIVSNKGNIYKPYGAQIHTKSVSLPYGHNMTNICSYEAAKAQQALLAPSISFGSIKSKALEKRIGQVVDKYSQGSNPFILGLKPGFLSKLAKKIAHSDKPVIVGITGESACGKTTILGNIDQTVSELHSHEQVTSTLLGDNYYKDSTHLYQKYGNFGGIMDSGYSFDSPEAVNLDKLKLDLGRLAEGKSIKTPNYDFRNGQSTPDVHEIKPSKAIIFDSIFALNPKLKESLDVGIYVETPADVIKERWYNRTAERNVVGEAADKQFKDVKEKAETFIHPMKKNADIVMNGNTQQSEIQNFTKDLYDAIVGNKKN